MIQVTVNGAAHRFEQPLNLISILEKLEMKGKKVAVCAGPFAWEICAETFTEL